ncbi:uncharacterized protein TNCV_3836151 [Trichonephila clavipes]|nr:uncharacterized protein TNCV_3836151 [Trichonephila clavipes]
MYEVLNSSNVNDVRFYLFFKTYQSKELDDNFEKKCRSFDSASLPPCKAELYQHLLRGRYVTKFWRNAHLKNSSSLSPLASGWIINDDKYDFIWITGEQFPSSVADIVIKRKIPALPQPFKLSPPVEEYGTFYKYRAGRYARVYGLAEGNIRAADRLHRERHPERDAPDRQIDEAHFWLNGYVNKQDCRIWSEANPQVYVETPLHPETLTVWGALWAGGILLQKR